jgi:uncharacterized Zn finger protein
MTKFDSTTYGRFVSKAKDEGIKVNGNLRTRQFKVAGSKGDALYTVLVAIGDMPDSAVCNCPAGDRGIACKHAAACLSAVRKAQASKAAKVLRAAQTI